MKLTKDDFFVDSNIFIYLFDQDFRKKEIALQLLTAQPIISVQVISENLNILFKKFPSLTAEQVKQHKDNLIAASKNVAAISTGTLHKACDIKMQYRLQWYDSLIVATALLANCKVLYSEDLQHLQQFEKSITVANPFLDA